MKNVESLTGTQISTRDGSEIDFDLTYKFSRMLDRSAYGVFVSKNQTKVNYPPSTIRARELQPPAIFPLAVPSLAASTFTFGALLWRYRKFKFKF
jgi:hypothetical protein